MNFDRAVDHILRLEGGYVNHPDDPGGETKFGISKRAYPELVIKEITIEKAKEIYERDYWKRCQIDGLPSAIRLMVFDAAVNQGPVQAIRMLQEVLGVTVDGVIGNETRVAAYRMSALKLIGEYMRIRRRKYQSNAMFKTFGAGWLVRLMDVTVETLNDIGNYYA